jgi:hypothetical protein
MERAQQKCPVCEQSLHGSLANRPIRGQFGLEYDGRRIELCSWTCFCGFFQEPEHYYANYRAETNQVISRLEQILESHARLAER